MFKNDFAIVTCLLNIDTIIADINTFSPGNFIITPPSHPPQPHLQSFNRNCSSLPMSVTYFMNRCLCTACTCTCSMSSKMSSSCNFVMIVFAFTRIGHFDKGLIFINHLSFNPISANRGCVKHLALYVICSKSILVMCVCVSKM
jgi:hypothetical protein